MILLSIIEIFNIQEYNGDLGNKWLEIIITSILSGIVAWFSVRITLWYQIQNEKNKDSQINVIKREVLIEINKRIYSNYISIIKNMKTAIREFQFNSKKTYKMYIYNIGVFKSIDKYEYEDLFSILNDLNLKSDDKKDLLNYKLAITSIYNSFTNLHKQQDELMESITNFNREIDLFLTETFSEIQHEIFKIEGSVYPKVPSKIFSNTFVFNNQQVVATLKFWNQIDIYFKEYQLNVKTKNIRREQLVLLKLLLKHIRDYQKYKFLDVRLAQKVQTGISMIEALKVRYASFHKITQHYKHLLHEEMKKVMKFSRILKKSHRFYISKRN